MSETSPCTFCGSATPVRQMRTVTVSACDDHWSNPEAAIAASRASEAALRERVSELREELHAYHGYDHLRLSKGELPDMDDCALCSPATAERQGDARQPWEGE